MVLSDNSGNKLTLSDFRIVFRVTHGIMQTPRHLEARIYNPNAATINRIKSKYSVVELSVGYGSDDDASLLFQGMIWQTRDGRENPTDTFIDIIAATRDTAFTTGTISTVLAAGYKYSHVQNVVAQNMASDNIAAGAFPDIPGSAARPKVMYGMTRDHCRTLAHSTASMYFMDEDSLNYVTIADTSRVRTTQTVIELSPETGLIGIPVQTPDGIDVTCLLDPAIKVNSRIRLINAAVLDQIADLSYSPSGVANAQYSSDGSRAHISGVNATGDYRVVWADHYGDTYGNDWFSSLKCISIDPSDTVQSRSALEVTPE